MVVADRISLDARFRRSGWLARKWSLHERGMDRLIDSQQSLHLIFLRWTSISARRVSVIKYRPCGWTVSWSWAADMYTSGFVCAVETSSSSLLVHAQISTSPPYSDHKWNCWHVHTHAHARIPLVRFCSSLSSLFIHCRLLRLLKRRRYDTHKEKVVLNDWLNETTVRSCARSSNITHSTEFLYSSLLFSTALGCCPSSNTREEKRIVDQVIKFPSRDWLQRETTWWRSSLQYFGHSIADWRHR